MKIGFLVRTTLSKWGGDLAVINQLVEGLCSLGHHAVIATSPFMMADADFIFIAISFQDHRQALDEIALLGIPFGILGFHEDQQNFFCPANGFFQYVQCCLNEKESIDELYENPQRIYYFGEAPSRGFVYNFRRFQKAKLWIANSPTEAKIIERDFPGARIAIIPVAPGIVTRYDGRPDQSFLTFSGLSSGNYLVQMGRLEVRKNQLATILATRNLDIPLVFIATKGTLDYEIACFEAAAKWRKAPTLFINQTLKEVQKGAARTISMPNETKLPFEMVISAYAHAGLHIHLSFNELPGATYLEAARLGTPTIASNWCTIKDYFFDPVLGHASLDGRIVYSEPTDLKMTQRLAENLFGVFFPPLINHPAIQRTEVDAASELLAHLQLTLGEFTRT
jgi:glycosyltransferase involved in cell wall biosynthesis